MTSHQLHDDCIAARKAVRAASPEMFAEAAGRGPVTIGTPVHSMRQDLDAPGSVASAFATGIKPRAAAMKRARAVLAKLAAA